jgi:hypothetical protein
MLHTPIYDVRVLPYCGPTAIAAVTGEPVSVIRDIIRSQIGTKSNGDARPIMGVSREILLKTMHTLGWLVIAKSGDTNNRENPKDVFRLGDFLDHLQMREQAGPYIVNVTRHYYAVDQDEICDTRTRIPLEVHRFKRGRRRWVQCWWQFAKPD